MKCKNCPEGRHFAKGSTYCIPYGMIIRDENTCRFERGKRHDGTDADQDQDGGDKTELQKNGCGAA